MISQALWKRIFPSGIMETMIPDPLLDTAGPADSLALEIADFTRRLFSWREGERQMVARYSWDASGKLTSREHPEGLELFAYTENGHMSARYELNKDGKVMLRETWERDGQSRPLKRTIQEEGKEPIHITYEHDESGRIRAERQGQRVRVEKTDAEGRLVEEYLSEAGETDTVTAYQYTQANQLHSKEILDPNGTLHRRTLFGWDEEGRLSSLRIENGEGHPVREEQYAYGASHGPRWLERITWIPDGRKAHSLRPKQALYRSFSFGDERPPILQHTLAFSNGIYTGAAQDGSPHGQGHFQFNDGSIYQGEFRHGQMEGQGRMEWADGRWMEGIFQQGVLQGPGSCAWPDGRLYKGEFHQGNMHGPGEFIWPDGTRFRGIFEEGKHTEQGAWDEVHHEL
ncbi:MAG: hypothetical protein MI717_05725 [Spirochaetales bacterium]|nr:hypothetical protein [Spirochaetales bacterium]